VLLGRMLRRCSHLFSMDTLPPRHHLPYGQSFALYFSCRSSWLVLMQK
jgi:hypothetical protein